MKAALNQAIEDGSISHSPATAVKPTKVENVHREYLTFEELQRLVKEECRYPVLKQTFIFSCFTGMMWSYIQKFTWCEEQEMDGHTRIQFRQKKTKGFEYLDISDQAARYLGGIGNLVERVFVGLKYSAWHNVTLEKWYMKAEITKDITFHTARHIYFHFCQQISKLQE